MTRSSWRAASIALAALLVAIPLAAANEPVDEVTPPESLARGWYASIETSMGRIIARLLPDQAPQAVAHFVGMARGELEWTDPVTGEQHREPYYDGTRVDFAKAGFTFEVGRLSGSGAAAPLVYVPQEGPGPVNFFAGGRLGMGRSPLGRISAVIFFVTVSAQPWLNGEHPCFGDVVEGEEVAFKISEVKTYSNGRPLEDIRIERIRIFEVGDPSPLPEPTPYYPPLVTPTPVK